MSAQHVGDNGKNDHEEQDEKCYLHEEPLGKDVNDRVYFGVEEPIIIGKGNFMKSHEGPVEINYKRNA